MKTPDNSRYVLTWSRDADGDVSWIIDLHVNGIWINAAMWECTVVYWQELPDPPDTGKHPPPCGEDKTCSGCPEHGKCEWVL